MAGEFSDTPISPDNSPREKLLDSKNHLLKSENFGRTPKAVIIVTGSPEKPNEWAQSTGTSLDLIFDQVSEEMAVAQVYLGENPLEINNLQVYLQHALDEAKDAEVNLIVFSAGALSLSNLPEKYHQKIKSLTIFSPFIGLGAIRGRLIQGAALLMGLPTTDRFLKSLTPLINNLQKENKSIEVVLGQQDLMINSDIVEKAFRERFSGLSIKTMPRGHAPSPEEILDLIV